MEWDNTPKTVAFRNVSQLVAESLRFLQQAAGKAADIHRARRHEQDAASGGGKAASSGGPPRARAAAFRRSAWRLAPSGTASLAAPTAAEVGASQAAAPEQVSARLSTGGPP